MLWLQGLSDQQLVQSFFVEDGVPVIRGSNLSADINVRLNDDEKNSFRFRSKAREFSRSVARKGDLIFTCWGTINQVGFLDGSSRWDEYIISNKQMKLTVDPEIADPRYIYYLFSGPVKQQEILANGIGAAVPGFNLGQLRQHSFRLPPLPLQILIADHIEGFDFRAKLNRQTNQTLENMAQALFKSWFVDFDPVIDNALAAGNDIPPALEARAEGRKSLQARAEQRKALRDSFEGQDALVDSSEKKEPASLPKSIRQLFPDGFVFDAEMGWIPEGWEVSSLDRLIDLTGGGTPKTSIEEYWNGDIPWFSVVDAPNDSDVFVVDTEKHVTQLGIDNSSTKLLRAGTTIISARGTVGKWCDGCQTNDYEPVLLCREWCRWSI